MDENKLTYKVDWFVETGNEKIPNDFKKFTYHYEAFYTGSNEYSTGERAVFCKDELTFLKLLNIFNRQSSNSRITWKYWSE